MRTINKYLYLCSNVVCEIGVASLLTQALSNIRYMQYHVLSFSLSRVYVCFWIIFTCLNATHAISNIPVCCLSILPTARDENHLCKQAYFICVPKRRFVLIFQPSILQEFAHFAASPVICLQKSAQFSCEQVILAFKLHSLPFFFLSLYPKMRNLLQLYFMFAFIL